MVEAAGLAREAAAACDLGGRVLYAAHAALPWPQPAHLLLWHALNLLREHRGDGHIIRPRSRRRPLSATSITRHRHLLTYHGTAMSHEGLCQVF